MAKYYKVETRGQQLNKLRDESVTTGDYCGFKTLDEIYTAKKGYPLFIAGAPHSGKTEFTLELLINWSMSKGWKHFVYLGETGTVDEVVAELCHKYVGKPYRKLTDIGITNPYAMTDKERLSAEYWVNEHFVILDTEQDDSEVKDFTVEQFYKIVDETENELGIQFDTTVIDPFNDIDEEDGKYGGRIDRYLKNALKTVRRSSKKNKRIDILVNHIADIFPVTDKATGQRYTPPALPTEWAGGRVWHRRAFTMLLIYRPPTFLLDEEGDQKFEDNETIIINQKAKPKGSGKLGEASLFWDWKRSRYYEKNELGSAYYGNELSRNVKSSEDLQQVADATKEFDDLQPNDEF